MKGNIRTEMMKWVRAFDLEKYWIINSKIWRAFRTPMTATVFRVLRIAVTFSIAFNESES